MKQWLASFGSSAGSGFSVLCCVGKPALIGILSAMGLSVTIRDGIFLPFLVFFLAMNLTINYRSVKRHGRKEVFMVAAVSAVLIIGGLWFSGIAVGMGIAGIFTASGMDLYFSKNAGASCAPDISLVESKGGGEDGNKA